MRALLNRLQFLPGRDMIALAIETAAIGLVILGYSALGPLGAFVLALAWPQ